MKNVIKILLIAAALAAVFYPSNAGAAPETVYDVTTGCGNAPAATPNDGLDDSESIQACVDEIVTDGGGVLYFPPGVYDVERASHDACTTRSCSIDITGAANMTIRGEGVASIVRKSGAGGGSGTDWWTFRAGDNENLAVQDLTIDGNARSITNVGEQTHEFNFQITGAGSSTRVRFDRMFFYDSRGDCIRTVGNHTGHIAEEFIVTGSWFKDCKRGAIGVQRGVRHYVVTGNVMIGGTDQQIDFESSSHGMVERFTISNNVIVASGTIAVALSGSSFDVHQHSVFSGNFVLGRVSLYQNENLIVSNNTVLVDDGPASAVLDARKVQDGILITNNVLLRMAGATAGPVVQISHHGTGIPDTVILNGNRILQQTNSMGVSISSANRVVVTANALKYEGASGFGAGISIVATAADITSFVASTNSITGPWLNGIQTSTSPNDIDSVMISDNVIDVATKGVLLSSGTGSYTTAPMVTGNVITATTPIAAAQMEYVVGGNAGSVEQRVGYNAPSGACVSGSTFAATKPADEGFYVCTSAGWVLIE